MRDALCAQGVEEMNALVKERVLVRLCECARNKGNGCVKKRVSIGT